MRFCVHLLLDAAASDSASAVVLRMDGSVCRQEIIPSATDGEPLNQTARSRRNRLRGSRAGSQRMAFESDSDSTQRRIESLRQQLLQQNRRAAGPFSHPLASRGPLKRLREHICDLSRLTDAAILSAESSSPERIQTLTKDLLLLLQTQQTWTDRLENQIWRLESQRKWQLLLKEILDQQPLCSVAVRNFCETIALETISIPSGNLLLPEPGLPLSWKMPLSEGDELGRSIEQIRLAAFIAGTELEGARAADIVATVLRTKLQTSFGGILLPRTEIAADVDFSLLGASASNEVGISAAVEKDLLIPLTVQILSTIEEASLAAADSAIPPAITDYYSRACAGLLRKQNLPIEDRRLTEKILRALCLECPDSTATSVPERATEFHGMHHGSEVEGTATVLTHKLRRHAASSEESIRRPRISSAYSGQLSGASTSGFREKASGVEKNPDRSANLEISPLRIHLAETE